MTCGCFCVCVALVIAVLREQLRFGGDIPCREAGLLLGGTK